LKIMIVVQLVELRHHPCGGHSLVAVEYHLGHLIPASSIMAMTR
jgi:hypothetical protein